MRHPFSLRTSHPVHAPIRPAFIPELDLVRALTCAAVVGVHALGMVGRPDGPTAPFGMAAGAVTTLLHYSREAFMIATGLVLAHSYRESFDGVRFYSRRLAGRALPYALWTAAYLALGFAFGPTWWPRFWRDLVFGSASYQLYYMVVLAQFYLVLPALLTMLRQRPRAHMVILVAALAWQVAWYAVVVPLSSHHAVGRYGLGFLEIRSLFTYPFYFVLGALWGWQLEAVRNALLRHWRAVVAAAAASILVVLVRYFVVAGPLGLGPQVASSVFEPAMIPYSALVTASIWLAGGALASASSRPAAAAHRAVRFVSAASFGIYLVHVMVLRWAYSSLPPLTGHPFTAWALLFGVTFGGASGAAWALGSLPWGSGLVGGPRTLTLSSAKAPPAA